MEIYEKLYGTNKSSYEKHGNCKLVIRHKKSIDDKWGARSRNIDKIFVQTKEGERLLCPKNHLLGARALARHIDNGGKKDDDIANWIFCLVDECKDLAKVSHHIGTNKHKLNQDGLDLRNYVKMKLNDSKHQLRRLSQKRGYNKQLEYVNTSRVNTMEDNTLEEKVNELADKLGAQNKKTVRDSLYSIAKKTLEENENTFQKATQYLDNKDLKSALETLEINIDTSDLEDKEKDYLALFLKAYGPVGKDEKTESELLDLAEELASSQVSLYPKTSKDKKPEEFKDKYKRMGYQLGNFAHRIKNDLLSNIVSRVSYKLTHKGQSGVDPVGKEEAQLINRIVSGSENQKSEEVTMEDKDLEQFFETYEPNKFFESRDTKMNKKAIREFIENTEKSDTAQLTEDEVWSVGKKLVDNTDNPKKVRGMMEKLSKDDQQRILENIREVFQEDISTTVKNIVEESPRNTTKPVRENRTKQSYKKKKTTKESKTNAEDMKALMENVNDSKIGKTKKLDEKTPPGQKDFVEDPKVKKSFKKKYGDDWEKVLYATAWKRHNKGIGEGQGHQINQKVNEIVGIWNRMMDHRVNEGTWVLPDTTQEAQKLQELMSEPLPAQEAPEKLYGIFGDDALFDEIGAVEETISPDADVRHIVADVLSELMSDPESFVQEWDAEALKIVQDTIENFDGNNMQESSDDCKDEEEPTYDEDEPINRDMFDDFYRDVRHPHDEYIRQGNYYDADDTGQESPVGSTPTFPNRYFGSGSSMNENHEESFMLDDDNELEQKRLYFGNPEEKDNDSNDGRTPIFPYSVRDFVDHGDGPEDK